MLERQRCRYPPFHALEVLMSRLRSCVTTTPPRVCSVRPVSLPTPTAEGGSTYSVKASVHLRGGRPSRDSPGLGTPPRGPEGYRGERGAVRTSLSLPSWSE